MTARTQVLAVLILMAACGRRTTLTAPPEGRAADAALPGNAETAGAPARPAVPFTVVSDIPDCLAVLRKGTASDSNLLLGIVELKTTRMTADCGCTSKWLLYRSVTTHLGLETQFASGSLLFSDRGAPSIERRVVLLGDKDHSPSEPLTLHVSCEPAP
jgi:hypothetical protein